MAEDVRKLLRSAYREFNARDIDAVLKRMAPDVTWPNGMEGGFVHGQEGVREYWTRQWQELEPHVEPLRIQQDGPDGWRIKVHQVVCDKAGNVLVDTIVFHRYTVVDGLIQKMDIQ